MWYVAHAKWKSNLILLSIQVNGTNMQVGSKLLPGKFSPFIMQRRSSIGQKAEHPAVA